MRYIRALIVSSGNAFIVLGLAATGLVTYKLRFASTFRFFARINHLHEKHHIANKTWRSLSTVLAKTDVRCELSSFLDLLARWHRGAAYARDYRADDIFPLTARAIQCNHSLYMCLLAIRRDIGVSSSMDSKLETKLQSIYCRPKGYWTVGCGYEIPRWDIQGISGWYPGMA